MANIDNNIATGVGGLLGVMAFIKLAMKWIRGDKLEGMVVSAQGITFENLTSEINRQAGVIRELQEQIRALNNRLDVLRDIELEGATDIAKLTVYIQQMPCGKCSAPDDVFAHIEAIIERINQRRKRKQYVITGDGDV